MVNPEWFPDLEEDFEESVRIDREEQEHRRNAIESYHVTADAQRFMTDFVDRLLGQADDMRSGVNYWLYGYYGSGKSHLLTVFDGLMDTKWLSGRQDAVWQDLVPEGEGNNPTALDALKQDWKRVHEEFHIIPISVNLLKYQGQEELSFSEIVLRHAHQHPLLTGVDDGISQGFSPQLEIAYFEDWYRTTDYWPQRERQAAEIVEDINTEDARYDWRTDGLWSDIQQYGALADLVLPSLFEDVVGTRDGYQDLVPSDIDPEAVVSRLEELRAEREATLGKPVKLVLLLDEVSLFIGTDFAQLTELQTLAENVDEIGDGEIQMVVTAQARIEDVQPRFAAHGADFSILKDRFPHRYQLPSRHVGDIAKRRLFKKSAVGRDAVQDTLDAADIKPSESLIYNDVEQNTDPPLDDIDSEALVEFYPFLPYHAPLFLEILFNLRKEARDPAKSIFSGTARAILALMHRLLSEWIETGERDQLVSLVDFYELIEPELRDILDQEIRVVEGDETVDGIVDDESLTEFDRRVARAVLLLRRVHEMIPLTEGNIAVAVMSDLNGRSWISTTNRVEESLDRLEKYIRPAHDETGPRYRFATQVERLIYEETEASEADPDWDAILAELDEHRWDEIAQDLGLPESVPYGESNTEYPVRYGFTVDGVAFDTTVEPDEETEGMDVHIAVEGIRPDAPETTSPEDTLYWPVETDGIDDLRKHLIEWWALRDAVTDREVPPAVERDLERRADAVRSKLVSAMSGATFTVKDRTGIPGLRTAVETAVDVAYPDDFHPMMLQVDDDRLQELADIDAEDPLPGWARLIQVPGTEPDDLTIRRNVMSLTGRQLKDRDDGLTLQTVLDGIVKEKPYYDETRAALCAIVWGFCREERLVPIDEEGNTLANETVLDRDRAATTRLKLLPRIDLGGLLEAGGFKETTETVADGLINLQEANQTLHTRLGGLEEDVRLTADTDVNTSGVVELLEAFADRLAEEQRATHDRLATIRAQDEGIETAIKDTQTAQAWFEEVTEVWNRRREELHTLDAQLTLGTDRFVWPPEELVTTIEDRRTTLEDFDGAWWTTEGWSDFSSVLVPDLTPELTDAWTAFVETHRLDAITDRIESHPWVRPPMEVPTGVHTTFERELIAPLRAARRWYSTVDDAIAALEADDPDRLIDAVDEVRSLDTFEEAVGLAPGDLEDRLDRLDAAVGDHHPDSIDQIGVLPGDRDALNDRIARLIETRDPELTGTEAGVIIR